MVVQAGDNRPDKHDRQPVSLCYPLLERVRSLLFLVPMATKKCSYPLPLTQRPTAPSVDSLLQAKADMRANWLAYSLSANGVKFFRFSLLPSRTLVRMKFSTPPCLDFG